MHNVFYGRLISYAKTEIKNIEPLLVRAYHGFLFENSVEEAIKRLADIQLTLIKAKESYLKRPPTSS
uniref:Uncharacterized protein n=1 Tax=viral metagenome TaxID=1070528 RepID=A0A6C0JQC6_9ZZZZ